MKELLVMIPGNPSIPGIYDPFISLLKNGRPDLQTEVLSHLGQAPSVRERMQNISLMDVMNDHRDTIKNLIATHGPDRLYLVGHSLGSSVTMNLHKEFSAQINKTVIICPFFGPREHNRRNLELIANPVIRKSLTGGLGSLLKNKKVTGKIIEKWITTGHQREVIEEQISRPHYFTHFLSLVSSYTRHFPLLELEDKVRALPLDETFFIFAPDDYWVPDEVMNIIPEGARTILHEELQHDFCLSEKQTGTVAGLVDKFIFDE